MTVDYQRLIIGYHGCDRSVAEDLLFGRREMLPSRNPYDWLGEGIYFWEHGPRRALDFAIEQQERGKISEPFVLGAYIHLGCCFDLCDIEAAQALKLFFPLWKRKSEEAGIKLPTNRSANPGDHDLLLRFLDCAVLNAFMTHVDQARAEELDGGVNVGYYQTVRGVFVEGEPLFVGSKIHSKTHVQVAVRDTACILGFFVPRSTLRSHGE